MATTTNYSWTTPDDTDLVKDGAAAIRTLGSSVDTTTKALNPSTTLGDIEYRSSTANTNTRLGIGTTGQVLTVAGGVPSWATASGEKSINVPQIASNYIKNYSTAALTNFVCVEDVTYYYPIYLPGYALDRIGIRTSNGTTGNNTTRLGIYNTDSTTGKPSTVYLDAGTVVASTINTNFEITISSTPPAGYYYLAINIQATTGNRELAAVNASTVYYMTSLRVASSLNTTTYRTGFSESAITGAFATAGTLTAIDDTPVLLSVRMA
jgi:hypothetical protein